MFEHSHVEKPFLDQLHQLGWTVIDLAGHWVFKRGTSDQ